MKFEPHISNTWLRIRTIHPQHFYIYHQLYGCIMLHWIVIWFSGLAYGSGPWQRWFWWNLSFISPIPDSESGQIIHNISTFTTNCTGALCCIELWYDFVLWHMVQAPDRGDSGEIGASYLSRLTQNQSNLSTTFVHLPASLRVHYVALNWDMISWFGI